MAFQIRKAERTQVAPKIAISGPSGSGKTLTALMMAYGITNDWSKILVIDTENNSAELYANAQIKNISKQIGQFDVIPFGPPFSPERYVEAIHCAEQAKYQVIIIDSLSHSWNGTGGALDKVNNSATSNSYAAWKNVTPIFQRMIDKILQSNCTIICTMRAKQDYVMETNDKGKQVPRKVGMAPIIRDGIEYEFTTVFDIDLDHSGFASKDRTGVFNGRISMDESVGTAFEQWRINGSPIVRDYPTVQPPTIYGNTFNQSSAPTAPPVAPPSFNQAPPQMNAPAAPPVMTQPQPPVNNAAPEFTTDHQKVLGEIMDIATRAGLTTGEQLKALSSKAFNTPTPKSSKAMTIEELTYFRDFLNTEFNKPTSTEPAKPLF